MFQKELYELRQRDLLAAAERQRQAAQAARARRRPGSRAAAALSSGLFRVATSLEHYSSAPSAR